MSIPAGPAARLARLREKLAAEKLPGLLITNILNARYVTGFTGSTCHVVVTPTRAAIVTDSRYWLQAEREAPLYELVKVVSSRKYPEVTAELIQSLGLSEIGFEMSLTVGAHADLAEHLSGIAMKPAKGLVEGLRAVKDAGEIEKIRGAVAIVDACYEHILPFVRAGATERDVAVEIECFVRRQGARREAFDTIVASGVKASSPHALATEKVIAPGEMVKMDFGAMFQGYAADITRTVAVERADEKLREVYAVVLEAQLAAIAAIRPGVKGVDVDKVARDVIAARGYGERFGHGLGHALGLDVHDGPAFAPTSEVVLEAGMVVTVEPGIYIPEWGGVRIEDDVVVTEDGVEVLTRASKELTVVGV